MSSPTNKYQGWTTIWSPWPFPLYHQPRLITYKEERDEGGRGFFKMD